MGTMASQAARFALLLLVFSGLGMLFYLSEYRLVPVRSRLTTKIPDSYRRLLDNPAHAGKTNHTILVDSYRFMNDTLQVDGYYYMDSMYSGSEKSNDTNNRETLILKIGGLSDLINKLKPKIFSDKKLKHSEDSGKTDFRQRRTVTNCDCNAIFKNNQSEIDRAKALARPGEDIISADDYMESTNDCSAYIHERGYIMDSLTQTEEEFPIAFSILMYTAIEQSERLLRAIYRPQNIYCIHVDSKTEQSIFDAMSAIADCFDNVFISSARFDVIWGTMTVLEPDLQCMSELYNRSQSWKYFINLTGQEFPLRTNSELVQILKAYNGANDIDGTRKRANVDRWADAGTPPHNITPSKGSLHITASRGYVDFVLHDQRAKDFLEWCRKVKIPDEVFFTSLQHNPHLGVPGSYKGIPETYSSDSSNDKPFVTRFKNWGDGVFNWPCKGYRLRLICVFGVGDLPLLATRKELFANKIMEDFEPMALDCLEELHFNHTRDSYLGKLTFDTQWYRNLGFVKNKVK